MRSNTLRVLGTAGVAMVCAAAVPLACSDNTVTKSHILDQPDTSTGDASVPDTWTPPPDGSTNDAPSDAPADGDAGPAPVCSPAATYGSGSLVQSTSGSLSTNMADWLGSITGDELSIAWMTGSDPNGTIYYADRSSTAVPFALPQTVKNNVVDAATDRVALTPDGLGLAVVASDRRSFTMLTRATRGDKFDNPDASAFFAINQMVSESPSDQIVGDPIYGQDGLTFAFSFYGGQISDATIRISSRPTTSDPWSSGSGLYETELALTGSGQRRHATGLSSDTLTLFYWDESTLTEKAAWRPDTSSDFAQFVDLGLRIFAAPSSDCTKLYYSGGTSDAGALDASTSSLPDLDLYVANKN